MTNEKSPDWIKGYDEGFRAGVIYTGCEDPPNLADLNERLDAMFTEIGNLLGTAVNVAFAAGLQQQHANPTPAIHKQDCVCQTIHKGEIE